MNEQSSTQTTEDNPNKETASRKIFRVCFLTYSCVLTMLFALCTFGMTKFMVNDLINVITLKNNGISTSAQVISSKQFTNHYRYSTETLNVHVISFNSNLRARVLLDRIYPVNSYVSIIYERDNQHRVLQGNTSMGIGEIYFLNSEAHGDMLSFIYLHGMLVFMFYLLYVFLKFLYQNFFT